MSAYDAIDHVACDQELGSAGRKKIASFKALIEGLRGEAKGLSPHSLAGRVLESDRLPRSVGQGRHRRERRAPR